MNKTYDVTNKFDSNKGIYDAFYAEIVAPALSAQNFTKNLLDRLKNLRTILCGATAKRLARVTGVACALLGIVGVAGGIQHGKISLLGGIAVTVALLGVEYICLRKQK